MKIEELEVVLGAALWSHGLQYTKYQREIQEAARFLIDIEGEEKFQAHFAGFVSTMAELNDALKNRREADKKIKDLRGQLT